MDWTQKQQQRGQPASPRRPPARQRSRRNWLPTFDVLALLAWGVVLLRFWATGQLRLLIHPNYTGLVVVTGLLLMVVGGIKAGVVLARGGEYESKELHLTNIPAQWSTSLLLATALLGLTIAPRVLSSQTALQRGVSESLPVTRVQPQSFRATVAPESRSLVEWIRTINAYPEPEAYRGQPVRVRGFVIHSPHLPPDYVLVARFIITCCAVDAYPVALPVQLPGSRHEYPPDTWVDLEGEMSVTTLPVWNGDRSEEAERRQVAIVAHSLEKISTPRDPYEFHS